MRTSCMDVRRNPKINENCSDLGRTTAKIIPLPMELLRPQIKEYKDAVLVKPII